MKFVIKNLYKRGTRTLAKVLLKSHQQDAIDTDMLHDFERVMIEEGLLANANDLVDSTYTDQGVQVS